MKAIIILSISIIIVCAVFRKKCENEKFIDSPAPFSNPNALWTTLEPIEVDISYWAQGDMMNSYLAGKSPMEIQNFINEKLIVPFPNEDELNNNYDWKHCTVKKINKELVNSIIDAFMTQTNIFNDLEYYIVASRITHANVSRGNDYLLSFQIIFYKESTMYAKVVDFTVLYIEATKACIFTKCLVSAVIHL
jgi:hypothetical protein